MKITSTKAVALILATLVLFNSTTAFATEQENVMAGAASLEQTTVSEITDIMTKLVNSIRNKDTSYIMTHATYFDSNCYDKILKYTESNSIGGTDVKSFVVDFTYPDNSTTKDTVIMVNAKINYSEGYNKLYLFEFHVNQSGNIYGYNIWQY